MMSETEIKTEIFAKLETLNLEAFILTCKIDRYKDKMTEKLYKKMTENLHLLYNNEFERKTKDYFIEFAKEIYEKESRSSYLVPRRSWFFGKRNKAAKLIDRKVEKEVQAFFKTCEDLLAQFSDDPAPSQVNELSQSTLSRCTVNDRSEQPELCNVAKTLPESLPITTLQACDELVNYAPPMPQKPRKRGPHGADHNSDEAKEAPKTGKKQKEKIE